MGRVMGRRLLTSFALLFVVTFLVFFLQSLAPGDLAISILGEGYAEDRYRELRQALGLNDPLMIQYWHWLSGVLQGDLGKSAISGLNVGTQIVSRLGVTLSLVLATTVFITLLGVALGIVGAIRGGWIGRTVDVLSLLGFAVPNFWLGLVLIAVFAVGLRALPATGYVPLTHSVGSWAASLVLPVMALATHGLAVVAKQTRNAMIDALSSEYVNAARAHGVSEVSIVLRHALRNSAIPIITVIGLAFMSLFNGTVLIETVFAMPGLGGLAIQAAQDHDTPVVQGIALVFIAMVVVANLLVDLCYSWLNPKVRTA